MPGPGCAAAVDVSDKVREGSRFSSVIDREAEVGCEWSMILSDVLDLELDSASSSEKTFSKCSSPDEVEEFIRVFSVEPEALFCRIFSWLGFSDVLAFSAFRISTGKSTAPIMRLPMVPSNADAPPEIGSQGPSSISYSRGRYLNNVSVSLQLGKKGLSQFQIVEVQKTFINQSCCCKRAEPHVRSLDPPDSRSTWRQSTPE